MTSLAPEHMPKTDKEMASTGCYRVAARAVTVAGALVAVCPFAVF